MSKFKATHKTPDGTLLHGEGGKYYTRHAYENFGSAYVGPAEEIDAERFVFRLQEDVDQAANKAARVAAVNQAMSQGRVAIPPASFGSWVSLPMPGSVPSLPKRDGVKYYATLPTNKTVVALTYRQGGWLVDQAGHVSSSLAEDVVDLVSGSLGTLIIALARLQFGPCDRQDLADLLVEEEKEHRAGLAARAQANKLGLAGVTPLKRDGSRNKISGADVTWAGALGFKAWHIDPGIGATRTISIVHPDDLDDALTSGGAAIRARLINDSGFTWGDATDITEALIKDWQLYNATPHAQGVLAQGITAIQALQVHVLVDHAWSLSAPPAPYHVAYTYVIIGETASLDKELCAYAKERAKHKFPGWKVDFVGEGWLIQSPVIDYYVVNPTSFQPGNGGYWGVDEQCVIKHVP